MANVGSRPLGEARPVGIGFSHTATLETTGTGAQLTIRGPRGVVPMVVDVSVTEDGAVVRMRDTVLYDAARAPRPAEAPPASPAPPVPSLAATLSSGAPASGVSRVAPVAAGSPFAPRLSLQQYASLRAECVSTTADKLAQVRARYSLDQAGDDAEAEAWRLRFAQDPSLFESYKRLFQTYRAGPASRVSGAAVPSTAALTRVLTLGEHATMTAELAQGAPEAVYAKYDLADPKVRAQVLRLCDERLKDPGTLQTFKQLQALAAKKLEAGRR
jgi:hypothetical protein